jgi:hypothetical protein
MEFPRTIKGWQFYVAGALVVASLLSAVFSLWPFDLELPPPRENPSVWEVLLHDRLVLGFLRLALTFVALYAIASIPALAIAGRWMKGFGSSGLSVDEVQTADTTIGDLAGELEEAKRERDEALDIAISLDEENEDLLEENEQLRQIVSDLQSQQD